MVWQSRQPNLHHAATCFPERNGFHLVSTLSCSDELRRSGRMRRRCSLCGFHGESPVLLMETKPRQLDFASSLCPFPGAHLSTTTIVRRVTLSEAKGLCRSRLANKRQRLRFFAALRMTRHWNLVVVSRCAPDAGEVRNEFAIPEGQWYKGGLRVKGKTYLLLKGDNYNG